MIIPFSSAHLPTLAEVGGKGLSLTRMTGAGLPVPPGFTLAVEFFAPWIAALHNTREWAAVQIAIQNGDDLATSTQALKATCSNLAFAPEQEQALTEALQALPAGSLLAVRSSSPEEDLAGASFAGGYETTLGVTAATLKEAIRESFASAFDERVFVYKRQHDFAVDQPRIAVIVQQQIAADVAGVGFSLNPLNNDYDEAVIDANWGLGESVVAGAVSPDHFVVDKVNRSILEQTRGSKAIAIWLKADGGTIERANENPGDFCLSKDQVLAITDMISRVEALYGHPIDIEWAIADGTLYLLQARPITAYIPLAPEMMTRPGERRILYFDPSLTEGMATNAPLTPLTISWFFESMGIWGEPLMGPIHVRAEADPKTSLLFGAGGRWYMNASQVLTVYSLKKEAQRQDASQIDALLISIMENLDEDRYRAARKVPALRWGALLRRLPVSLWYARHLIRYTLFAVLRPQAFFRNYERRIEEIIKYLKEVDGSDLSLRDFIHSIDRRLMPVVAKAAFAAIFPYMYYWSQLEKLIGGDSEEDKLLVDAITMGVEGNEAIDLGIRQYQMAKMLAPEDFADLDELAGRIARRDAPADFLTAWDAFMADYALRGPGETELAAVRYGDDPLLALEQMSYMVRGDFDPAAMQKKRMADRVAAYQKARQKLSGRKRRRLEHAYKIVDLFGGTRETPKYIWVLDIGAVRKRALQEGHMFVELGRLDSASDIFWLTLDEIDAANADPAYDLREAIAVKQPLYRKLEQVTAFPHMIDSRGRIGQAALPTDDPRTLVGMGISRGVTQGRIKVLHTPREKPVEKGDVLVAYTTDPGWTPLFVNAEAVLLEVGGMLQHGGVVAREYGKPCVSGIQGITTRLQDGQLVEVDGTNGLVRLLD